MYTYYSTGAMDPTSRGPKGADSKGKAAFEKWRQDREKGGNRGSGDDGELVVGDNDNAKITINADGTTTSK